jgi:hypothetical protein
VNYFEFLGQPYNLPWLAAATAGLVTVVARALRRGGRSGRGAAGAGGPFSLSTFLLTAGIAGLTLNGALHDLRLGPIGPRQPVVAVASLAAAWLLAWGAPRLRRRVFPPVTAVKFNEPGLEGAVAVVLSRSAPPGGEPGRARHHDVDGVSHIVRITPADDRALRFGM